MDMNKRISAVAGGAAVVAAVAIGGAATASGGGESDSDDVSLSSAEGKEATAAALAATNGGTANSVEKDNENGSIWEVEVTRDDGSTVDVRLDKDYKVVVIEGDDEGKDDADNNEPDDQEGPGAFDDDSDVGDDNSDND